MSRVISQDLQATGVAQVIVVLKDAVVAQSGLAKAGPVGSAAVGAAAPLGRHFLKSDLSQDRALASSDVPTGRVPPSMRYYPNLGVALGTVSRSGLAALRSDPRVQTVQGAPQFSLIAPERVAAAKLTGKRTWGIDAIGAQELWKQGFTGEGILIGHLDTGVDGKHPALTSAIQSFANFDLLGWEATPTPAPFDSAQHGTHTAATIAGRPVGGRHVGVAPDSSLASAVVIEGGNVVARVLGGMDWAVGQRVRILSMSLGFRGWWEDFIPIARIIRRRNILPVFAVGNEGPGTSRSPGNYYQPISVGAIDQNHAVAWFSSSQRFIRRTDPLVPNLVAPGVGVTSARPGGGWLDMDGSSMATPHIAGLAALLMQARPKARMTAIEKAIIGSCQLEPQMARERANRGLPNGPRALAILDAS